MDRITELLERAKVIAVVGMSDRSHRDSYRIGEFLMNQGYRVYPVNPTIGSVLGLKSYPDLQSVPEKIDIVDVFRNPAFAEDVVRESLAVGAKSVWFQLGAEEENAEETARRAGLEVISGLCIAVEFRRRHVVRHVSGMPGRQDRQDRREWGSRTM